MKSAPAPAAPALRERLPCRLDKWLSDATTMSRRAIGAAFEAGRIETDSHRAVTRLDHLVFPTDEVRLDGVAVQPREPRSYHLLHKPTGVITAVRDAMGRACLDRFLGELDPGTIPVGRLDRDTTGLLLLTDDGDLAYMLIGPAHLPREYRATVEGRVRPDDARLQTLRDGFDIGSGLARGDDVRVVSGTATATSFRLAIDEGRYRQVRRMCRGAGFHLTALHRTRLGPLRLGALALGAMRPLATSEVDAIWAAVGGRQRVRERQRAALRARLDDQRLDPATAARLAEFLDRGEERGGPGS